jgi:hypothetical protein
MARLPPEQQLIADRLATGGMPAMRKAIADEQERAKAEGRPPVAAESILALAEQLQPDVKSAVWMDRAEAALTHLDDLGLRDLRATVVAAAPRDDAGRDLERQLREGLERRVNKLRSDWEEHLTQALTDGKVLQALRLSARPPEPTARFPAGLIERLVTQVGAAMSAETPPDRWLALLEAAAACPVRRQIKPAGIPEDPSGEVQRKAREAAGRIPALAPMLGMSMPPPPKPIPGERLGRPHPARPLRPRPPRPPGTRPPRPAGAVTPASPPPPAASQVTAPAPVAESPAVASTVVEATALASPAAEAPAAPEEAAVEEVAAAGLEMQVVSVAAAEVAPAEVVLATDTSAETGADGLVPASEIELSGEPVRPAEPVASETSPPSAEQPAQSDDAGAGDLLAGAGDLLAAPDGTTQSEPVDQL